jgi:hypothetical protein
MKTNALLAFTLVAATATVQAVPFMDFEGLGNLDNIQEFYNGGLSGMGYTGTNHGVSFSDNALALIDADNGGTGNIANEPSPSTVLFFLTGTAATMNVDAGFLEGFSFYYSSVAYDGVVNVYDGLNGTGQVLASLNLPALGYGIGDPNGAYGNWASVGVTFNGVAKSIDFGGTANYIVFDNVTLGPDAVPEPTMLAILGLGLGAAARRRRK